MQKYKNNENAKFSSYLYRSIQNNSRRLYKKKIKTKKDVALISDYGNISSAKLGVFNGNILNSPFSITNPFVMEIICENILKKRIQYLIFDIRTEKYFNNVTSCHSNFKQIGDESRAFPRFNLYKKIIKTNN